MGVGGNTSIRTLVHPSDEAKVAGAAFEGLEEIGMLVGVGVDHGPVGEDDLKVLDGITCEAMRATVEGVLCRVRRRVFPDHSITGAQ
jgi:hypothetical protein